MMRASRLTLPYSLCLFLGLAGIVAVVAGVPVLLRARGNVDTTPDRATEALGVVADGAARRLEATLGEPIRRVGLAQDWARVGLFEEIPREAWPETIRGLLEPLRQVDSFTFSLESGAVWIGARNRDGAGEALPFHLRLAEAEGATGAAMSEAVHVDMENGRTFTARGALRFSGGLRGELSLRVSGAGLDGPAGGPAWIIDPRGERLERLHDAATRDLLTRRAISDDAFPALEALFDSGASAGAWYLARPVALAPDQTWWILARSEHSAFAAPPDPTYRASLWALGVGLAGAFVLAWGFGRGMTRPLVRVAARARSIRVMDEHYLPWPRSRFTEINELTTALEEIYEAAVEHLDYHDAPLVTWAETGEGAEGLIDVEATRHVFRFSQGGARDGAAEAPGAPPIEVSAEDGPRALPLAIPAAQLQVLHGTRRELRRLQSQLSGAAEALRTADQHHQQDLLRMKRLRNGLRSLESLLLSGGCASPEAIAHIRTCLASGRTAIWVAGSEAGVFHVAATDEGFPGPVGVLRVSGPLLRLLDGEGPIVVNEPGGDPRLAAFAAHPWFADRNDPRMVAPIRMAGALLGFLCADRPVSHGRWRGDEELFAMGAASLMSGVLWKQMRAAGRAMEAPPASRHPGVAVPRRGKERRRNGGPVPTVSWEIDRAGCIRTVSGDVRAVYGVSAPALIGQPITFLCDEAQGLRDMEQLAELLAGRACRRYETIHRTADGSEIHLRITAKVWRDASDRIAGARGTAELIGAVLTA